MTSRILKNGEIEYNYTHQTYTYGYSGKPKVSMHKMHLNGDTLVVDYATLVILEKDRYAKKKQADCELIAEGNFPAYILDGRICVADGFDLEELLGGVRCASGYAAKDIFKSMGWTFDWNEKVWVNPNYIAPKVEIEPIAETAQEPKIVTIAENGIARLVDLDTGEVVADVALNTGEVVEIEIEKAHPLVDADIVRQLKNALAFWKKNPKDRCIGVTQGDIWNIFKIEKGMPNKYWIYDGDIHIFEDIDTFWDAQEDRDAHSISYIQSEFGRVRMTRFVKN